MTSPDLSNVTPADVARYLASTGWTEGQQAPHLSIWSTADDGFEVLLPLDAGFRDYHARLRDAIHTIALAEERETREVLADLTATAVDMQHFRLLPDSPSGTIRMVDIVDVARGVRDLMYTAAHAAMIGIPMLVQPRPRPPQVNRFVRSVLLAAPTPGSFILSAHVPVRDDDGPLRFNRQVVLQLHRAVDAVHTAATLATARDPVTPFVERAGDGVSANLCQAIGLIGQTQPFDLRFTWAGSLPSRQAASHFAFDHRLVGVVQNAAQELPRRTADSQIVFTGRVMELQRAIRSDGRVTLRGVLDTAPNVDVTVTAALSPELYDQAIAAHRERRLLRVMGVIRGNEFVEVVGLEIIS